MALTFNDNVLSVLPVEAMLIFGSIAKHDSYNVNGSLIAPHYHLLYVTNKNNTLNAGSGNLTRGKLSYSASFAGNVIQMVVP